MLVDELLARARSALAMPTLYLLGCGGWTDDEPGPHPQPGREVVVAQRLEAMRLQDPPKHQRYLAEAAAAGIDLAALPLVMPACDCSGFVCWALGLPRRSGGHWLNTDAIWRDAQRTTPQLFRRDDSDAAPRRTRPGALLVYPAPAEGEVGHVGVVTQVDAAGQPTRVLHCAPENFLAPPVAGVRNAIAETGPGLFADPHTIAVWCLRLDG